jgi:hypothetical protein
MTETTIEITIADVAKILDKSDRQVRRYVKERRLKANPVRVDGHVKLMFNREEVEAFQARISPDHPSPQESAHVVMDGVLVDEVSDDDDIERSDDNAVTMDVDGGVKYVVDALREQLDALRTENRDLHYQLEQRSGQVGFLQAKIETLQEEVKALAPAKKMETADTRPWYKRMFGKQPSSE